jgi:hypothetical protein
LTILDGFTYFCLPDPIHNAADNVCLRHGQAWKGDLLVVIEKRQIFQQGLGLKAHFGRIGSQNALIEALNWRKGRLIAEKQLDEVQTFDMPTQND